MVPSNPIHQFVCHVCHSWPACKRNKQQSRMVETAAMNDGTRSALLQVAGLGVVGPLQDFRGHERPRAHQVVPQLLVLGAGFVETKKHARVRGR